MRSPRRGDRDRDGPVSIDCKVYIGDLNASVSKRDLEDLFGDYGRVHNVWIAKSPPGFGFVEFEDPRDADDAVYELDGKMLGGRRIRVEISNGRHKRKAGSGRGRPYAPDDKCYSCGGRGHYAYDCQRFHRGRSRSRSYSPRRSYSRSRSRSRDRGGRRRGRDRSLSRSRSPIRGRDRSKDRSPVRGRDRSRDRSSRSPVRGRDRSSRSPVRGKDRSKERSRSASGGGKKGGGRGHSRSRSRSHNDKGAEKDRKDNRSRSRSRS